MSFFEWHESDKIGNALCLEIDFKSLIIGVNLNKVINRIISVVCYLIFKKYLQDKEKEYQSYRPMVSFIRNELVYRLEIYKLTSITEEDKIELMKVIASLETWWFTELCIHL